jgi:hypothetical protein
MCSGILYKFYTKRDIITNAIRSFCKLPVILCHILIKLKISGLVVEIYSYIKLYENLSSKNCVIPCRRTEGQDEASSSFSQFYERT